jgi:hypothetical protein
LTAQTIKLQIGLIILSWQLINSAVLKFISEELEEKVRPGLQ